MGVRQLRLQLRRVAAAGGWRLAHVPVLSLDLVRSGLTPQVADDIASQDVPTRDHRNREAMFSPRTNPVWGLVDRLVGAETGRRMQALLD